MSRRAVQVIVSRKLGGTETMLHRWKKQYPELDVSELRVLKQLRDENRRLKQVVADLTLDTPILREALVPILREALVKKWKPISAPRGCGLGAERLPRE